MPKRPRFNLWRNPSGIRPGWEERAIARADKLSWLEKFAHFWLLVWRSFARNRCPVRASALSYTTLLALIPLLAVAVSVTSSLLKSEGEQRIDQFIEKLVNSLTPPALLTTNVSSAFSAVSEPTAAAGEAAETNAIPSASTVPTNVAAARRADFQSASRSQAVPNGLPAGAPVPQQATPATQDSTAAGTSSVALAELAHEEKAVAARKEIARRINEFVQNTRSGALGVTGMVLLVYVAISLLKSIEETFNDIWGVARGRNWAARIVRYWTTLTLGPFLLVGAMALASGPHFQTTKRILSAMPFVGNFIFQLLPLLVLWIAFALFYQLMPNTRVRWSAAIIGGIVGGTLWHLVNVFGFLFVSRVVTNFKIYGSLGLVPVFMIGLYFSWLILLFGAQVAYAYQNRQAYLQEKLAENVNQRGREFIALRLMTCIGQRFQSGQRPATIAEIANELAIPTRLVHQVMQTLLAAKLVVEVAGAETAFAPARPLDSINAHHILLAMRAGQGQEPATRDEPARAEVYGEFARIQEAERQAASTVTMLALVNRAQARLEIPPPANEQVDPSPGQT